MTALGVMRSLASAGIPFYNIAPQQPYVAASRFHRPPPVSWGLLGQGMPLDRYLRSLPLDRAVLIAGSDDRVKEAAALEGDLAARFPSSIAAAETVEALLDKLWLARLLAERRLPHPATFDIAEEDDLDRVPDEMFASAFLKPRDSLAFNRSYRTKGFRVASREDARRRLRELRARGFDIVLQDYVPGDASCYFFIDGFVDRHGAFPALFARQRLRMHPVDFGNSSAMVSVPLERVAGALSTVQALLTHVSYRGVFSAEFKLDARDGVFKLIEINGRPWWFNGFAADCGADVTLMAYRDALDLRVEPIAPYREGARLIHSFNDFKACYRLHRESRLRLGEALKFWLTARDAIFRWDDPRPWLYYAYEQFARPRRTADRSPADPAA